MPDAPDHPSVFLQHLDAVYAVARVLTADEDAARELVTTTFRQAADAPKRPPDPDALRTWLLRRLMKTHRTGSADSPEQPALSDVRHEMAENILQRLLPTAFASRPSNERVLLTLCAVHACSPAEAAEILDLDKSTVEERLRAARTHLWETVKASATPPERRLLQNQLSAEDASAALPSVLPDALKQAPPSLRPAAAAVLEQHAPRASAQTPSETPPETGDTGRFGAVSASRPSDRSSSRLKQSGLRDYARRSGAALVIIVVAGLMAYLLADALQPSDSSSAPANLIELSVQQADRAQPAVSTRDPDEAQRYLRDQTGRTLAIPTISHAHLVGAGTVDLTDQISVPTVFFADSTTGERITTYVLDYALLDRAQDRLTLATDVRRTLEQERTVETRTIGARGVLLWRERADIYVAVTSGNADSLKSRMALSS